MRNYMECTDTMKRKYWIMGRSTAPRPETMPPKSGSEASQPRPKSEGRGRRAHSLRGAPKDAHLFFVWTAAWQHDLASSLGLELRYMLIHDFA